MKLYHDLPCGRRVHVELQDDGAVIVTGAAHVSVHIPLARRGAEIKAFPKSPEGEMEITVAVCAALQQAQVTIGAGKPVIALFKDHIQTEEHRY